MITADPAVKNYWGTIWDETLAVVEQAIIGNAPITLTGTNVVLTTANNAPDQARSQQLIFVGTLTAVCTVALPAVPKTGLVSNNTVGGYSVILTTSVAGGRTLTVLPGLSTQYTCDGTNIDKPIIPGELPIGALMAFAGASAPPRWLLCAGQAVSRNSYSALFAVISTAYGAGDGSSTFNLPDLRGRAAFGLDSMGGTAAGRVTTGGSAISGATLGASGGNQSLQSHTHGITDPGHTHGINDPSHNHTVNNPSHTHGVNDPGHNHTLHDPQHNHALSDPGHAHGVDDPTHAHGVNDQGHSHSYTYPGYYSGSGFAPGSVAVGTGGNTSVNGTGISIFTAATGIGIHAASTGIIAQYHATGIYIDAAYTGITVQATTTGITNNPSTTGITNQTATTGITAVATGTGNSQNMPPALMLNTIIYAGA
jgi:microcystin-dependent protein